MVAMKDRAAALYPACIADRFRLLALMEFAGEGLIYNASSKDLKDLRLSSPRSDLFRHHCYITCATGKAVQLL
jgi:hypothetical protein